MITGVLTVAGGLISLLLLFFSRWFKKADDPVEQHRKRYAEIDEQVASKDAAKSSVGATLDLNELARLERLRQRP